MKNNKNFSLSFFWSVFIIAAVIALIFLLYRGGNVKVGEEYLPASVGKILSASPDHILVKFKDDAPGERRGEINAKYELKEKSEIKNIGAKLVTIPPSQTPEEVVDRSNKDEADAIEFAEPDFIVEPSLVPNDPWFTNWQKDKQQVNAPAAWESTTGSTLTLAIADTGVNCAHEDLAGQCVGGWNFYDNNSDTNDTHGHGTAVAGTAAAAGNNGIGIAGVTWQSKIMPLRVSAPDGTATYSSIASAISYAADRGVKVVNASYQVGGSSAVQSAANYLKSKGGLLVVSEGNYSSDTGYANSGDVISVSGVDASDVLYSWSNFGNDVDVSAPGCTGATTYNTTSYGSFCGTSNAAPEVAGLLMLIWGANPSLTPAQAENILFKSAVDLGNSSWDKYYGWGRINAEGAVKMAKEGDTAPIANPPPAEGDTTTPLVVIATPLNGINVSGTVTISALATDNTKVTKTEIIIDNMLVKTSAKNSISHKWVTKNVSSGTHTILVKAYDAAGNMGEKSVVVYK